MNGGVTTVTFVYDGDGVRKSAYTTAKPCGNRVKGTVGGTTVTYVGSHFEWKTNTSDMIKYYYSGGTRVAMRKGSSTRYYILTDHLGSTTVIANSSGAYSSEERYMLLRCPSASLGIRNIRSAQDRLWGEERWAIG